MTCCNTANMIDIKLGSEPSASILSVIIEIIRANPILLHNIMEPTVNGFMCDIDAKKLVRDELLRVINTKIEEDNIGSTITEEKVLSVLKQIAEGRYTSEYMEGVMDRYASTDGGQEYLLSKLDTYINTSVNGESVLKSITDEAISGILDHDERIGNLINAEMERTLEDKVSEKIENDLRDGNYERQIEEAIEATVRREVDVSDHDTRDMIKESISEIIDERITDGMITSEISDKLDEADIILKMKELLSMTIGNNSDFIKNYIQTNVSNIIKESVTELMGGMITKDEIKKLIVEKSQEIYKVVPVVEPVPVYGNYDTLTIQCKQDATPAFMWMLSSLVKDDVVRIIKGV